MGAITSKWAGSGAGSTSRGLHEKLKRIQHRDHFVLSSSSAKAINFTQSGISIPGDVLVLQLAKFLSLEDIANVLATSKAMMTLMNGASSSAEQQYHFSHTNALWEDIYNRTIWSTTSSVSSSSSSISFPSYVASSLCAPLPCTSLLNPTKPSRRPSLLPSRTSSSSSPSSITQNQCDSLDECCWYAKWLKRVGSQKEAAFRFRRYEDQQRCILNELQRREKQQLKTIQTHYDGRIRASVTRMMALCAALACLVVYFTWSILHSVVWFLPSVLYWLFSITYTVLRCGDKYECTVPGQLQSESVCFENTVSMEAYIEEYRHNLHRIVHVSAYHLQLPNAPTCVERYGFFYGAICFQSRLLQLFGFALALVLYVMLWVLLLYKVQSHIKTGLRLTGVAGFDCKQDEREKKESVAKVKALFRQKKKHLGLLGLEAELQRRRRQGRRRPAPGCVIG